MKVISKIIKSFRKSLAFNLIEITLAIAIAGLGLAGIMALFPVGFKATKDSIGDNYASLVAETFMSFIQRACNENTTSWDAMVNNGASSLIPESKPDETNDSYTSPGPTGWTEASPGTKIYSCNISTPGLYRVYMGGESGSYDFDCAVRVWRSQIDDMDIAGLSDVVVPYGMATRLNIELSWPLAKPYDNNPANNRRETRFYCIDIFKH